MKISSTQFAKVLARQKALADAEWLQRCDELAIQQRVLFLELVTFSRDGLPDQQSRCLIDFLSALQYVSSEVFKSAADPVLPPQFQSAIKRAMLFFKSITTDDNAHFGRLVEAWHQGTANRCEPVIWAGCIATLQEPGILTHRLGEGIVITLYAIADIYSRRLESAKN